MVAREKKACNTVSRGRRSHGLLVSGSIAYDHAFAAVYAELGEGALPSYLLANIASTISSSLLSSPRQSPKSQVTR